jgi:hypothetical protein
VKKSLIAFLVSLFVVFFVMSCASTGSTAAAPAAPAAAPAQVEESLPTVSASEDLVLAAAKAKLVSGGGEGIRIENGENVGWWSSKGDIVSWKLQVAEAGEYIIKVNYSVDPEFAQAVVKVTVGDSSLDWTVASTGAWGKYVDFEVGSVTLPAGAQTLAMQATTIKNRFVANVKSVTISKKK